MFIGDVTQLDDFLNIPLEKINGKLAEKRGDWWQKKGEQKALVTFKEAAKRVPAYQKFLKQHRINPEKIRTYREFCQIPWTDKKNYLDQYSLKELIWDGKLSQSYVINSSSGTTGKPYFWPCSSEEFVQGALIHELIFVNNFKIDKRKTLVIVCFGMGTWIAGMYTFLSSYLVGQKGYSVSIITPGFNKKEVIRILAKISPQFDQTVLAGYPTFVKDILEDWRIRRAADRVKRIKFLFAGEGFSEGWRDYILDMVKADNHLNDAINILGSADAAVMGFETPLSILIRKTARSDKNLSLNLFESERVPSLVNYIPTERFFEVENNELILTANRSLPLIRYNIHDEGKNLSYMEVQKILKRRDYGISKLLKENRVGSFRYKLPFVYVFGRGKFTATIYAANIYPENVREVLAHRNIRKYVTGKFTLETRYTRTHDHYLQLNVELAEKVPLEKALTDKISKIFVRKVRKLNSEYNRIYKEYGAKVKPRVDIFRYGDSDLFPKDKVKKTG